MTTWAVVPIKDFAQAKLRLRDLLADRQAGQLARAMAKDMIGAIKATVQIDTCLLVGTADAQSLAVEFDCEYLSDHSCAGLSAAVNWAAKSAVSKGCTRLVVLPSDLPAVNADDLSALLNQHHDGMTICPAKSDGGTNALVVTPPDAVAFCYGDDSAALHRKAGLDAGLGVQQIRLPAFDRDVDTADDLARLRTDSLGTHTRACLAEFARGSHDKATTQVAGLVEMNWKPPTITELQAIAEQPLDSLLRTAADLRDAGHGSVMTYSRKVFIPLTELCRDVCHYCTYAKTPRRLQQVYLQPEQVLKIAQDGQAAGCREALFTLGDKPELRYKAAREALKQLGYDSTLDYLAAMAKLVLDETGLLPHLNPGVMTAADYQSLRSVAPSMGIMLESSADRLSERGGPHFGSPDKIPKVRLAAIAAAGEAKVPLTSGILIGIGETRNERLDSLLALRQLHERYAHIQEVIIQNFVPKPDTKMAAAPAASTEELQWTCAMARQIFGPAMSIQAPPNLSAGKLQALIDAGVNDWGGVSPVTPDHVNPESPWPQLDTLSKQTAEAGKTLVQRLTIYPQYLKNHTRWLDPQLLRHVLEHADAESLARDDDWDAGLSAAPPYRLPRNSRPVLNEAIARALDHVNAGNSLDQEQVVALFSARGDDLATVCAAADKLRHEVCGDTVSYVVNRNINYTNLCFYKCKFCAFSKGKTSEDLRGKPYVLDRTEIARRASEAWERGATEVCLQGGIHPDFTGETYLEICRAVKTAAPDIHVHAFSPLEVTHGASTLGMSIEDFLKELQSAGLGSLPGTAAEILADDVREILCPDKLNTAEWLNVVRTAHQLGLPTTSTIMFGHMESTAHWAQHLLALRQLQASTGGITEFVPLPFVHREAPMYRRGLARPGPTYRESLLIHAVARLVLHPVIKNIQLSWVKLGPAGIEDTLAAGVNDLGGSLMNESISRAAGASHGQELPPLEMEKLILKAGRKPRQRTTLYKSVSADRRAAGRHPAPLSDTEQMISTDLLRRRA